jgi:hypothetical protein
MRYGAWFCLNDITDAIVKPPMTAHEIKKHLEDLNDEMERMKVKGRFSYVAARR